MAKRFEEFSYVKLVRPITSGFLDGFVHPIGSECTIVHVHPNHEAYEVEFFDTHDVATAYPDDLEENDNSSLVIIEYEDMTPEQQHIVDLGEAESAGSFPTGLSQEELVDWIKGMMDKARKKEN